MVPIVSGDNVNGLKLQITRQLDFILETSC